MFGLATEFLLITITIILCSTCNPNLYEHFIFRAMIPGAAVLKITVMDKGDMLQRDSSLGMVAIDLEER